MPWYAERALDRNCSKVEELAGALRYARQAGKLILAARVGRMAVNSD
jgi:hypothetical protein